jgi:transposase
MGKRPRILRGERKLIGHFDVVNPNAAGIDAGSETHYVSVPEDRDAEPVREFGTFTRDLEALAEWLIGCGITTVAIEATGVYWIPLYEVLEARGLNPQLVDARSVGKRSKKTDVLDCQWIRQLHTFGLLDASFRPPAAILTLRTLMRQRRSLIEDAARDIHHMQKALDQMNVKLHLVISDIVGVTGLRIIKAILAGKTSPGELAALRDRACKATEERFVAALEGNYRTEHLFILGQSLMSFEFHQRLIAECDAQIEVELAKLEQKTDVEATAKKANTRRKNQLHFDGETILNRIAGVDLTKLPGMQASSVLTVISETGTDMTPWKTSSAFAGWLALAPNPRITGGKRIRRGAVIIHPNRVAQVFRVAAQTLERANCALGAFFRRIRGRHGRPAAIKATAHKLAVVFYTMLKNQTPYSEPGADYYERNYREKLLNSLTRKAKELGFALVPMPEVH